MSPNATNILNIVGLQKLSYENFHLPKSTLFLLVSAFAGKKIIMNAYKDAMDKIHSLVLSQVQKGNGYPKILIESHEQAVISQSDRKSISILTERELNANNLKYTTTQKYQSKQSRNI